MARKWTKAQRAEASRRAKAMRRVDGKFVGKKGGGGKKKSKSSSSRSRGSGSSMSASTRAKLSAAAKSRPRRPDGKFARGGARNPVPQVFEFAVLNPTSSPGAMAKHVAKQGAGIGAAVLLGPLARGLSKQDGVVGEVIESATPIVLGYGVTRLANAPTVGGAMMGAGAALAFLSLFRRLKPKIPGIRDLDMGALGGTVFLRDNEGRVFVRGADQQPYRLYGFGPEYRDAAREPLVQVLLEDGTRASMEDLGYCPTAMGQVRVLRDPVTREPAVVPVQSAELVTEQAVSGIVPRAARHESLGAIVPRAARDESLGAIVPRAARDESLGGAADTMYDGEDEYLM